MTIQFHVTDNYNSTGRSSAFLMRDGWDDFSFKTMFNLIVFDEQGERNEIGDIKIGCIGQSTPTAQLLPTTFSGLDPAFFSLGQNFEYYENLEKLPEGLKLEVLIGLRDVVNDLDLFNKVSSEQVFQTSLLRQTRVENITGQFRRIIEGGVALTEYFFEYEYPSNKTSTLKIDFFVEPYSNPPTNVHVFIGRNGVGKTRLINSIVKSILEPNNNDRDVGTFSSLMEGTLDDAAEEVFTGIVSIAFSAFDSFVPYDKPGSTEKTIEYSHVGISSLLDSKGINPTRFTDVLVESINICSTSGKRKRWLAAITDLESDSIFAEMSLATLMNPVTSQELRDTTHNLVKKMSSGHRIILLTISKLIEKVEERTLVLLDEPESHLHPPLLAAFTRTLSRLLTNRNGVAIIATHSPVVIQEVPKSCVWKLRRNGRITNADRPNIETFGENVGVLTHEIFSLEVMETGHYKLIQDAVAEFDTYEAVLAHFDGQLGSEARAIVRSRIAVKAAEESR